MESNSNLNGTRGKLAEDGELAMFIDKKEHIVFSVFERANLEKIKSFLLENKQNNYNIFYGKLDIEKDIIPKQGGAHFPKVVFFKPKQTDIVVQYSNYFDGLNSLSNCLSDNLKEPFYKFEFSNPETLDKKFSFGKYGAGEILRVVYAMQDPKWIFYEQGKILPFENTVNYEKKRIKDRLNKEIIIKYCSQLGFEIKNNNFWESAEPSLFYECISW